jgi:excisionase family DNA binding protein
MIVEARLTEEDIERIAIRLAELLDGSHGRTAAWLDVARAAVHLGLTEDAIRGLVKRRQIPFHRTENGRIRFSVTDLNHWVRTGSCERAREDYHNRP